MRNLFVIAPDEHNMRWLRPLAAQLDCHFHEILRFEDVQSEAGSPFAEPLAEAIDTLDDFADAGDGAVDGIMGYWDFPVTSMLPILRRRYGCAGASLEAVLRCEHKFYSRILQREVAPEQVPAFRAVDPFDDDHVRALPELIGYPFWIKPIKAHSSQLGFRVEDRRDLVDALAKIRRGIARFGGPFDEALAQAELPPSVAEVKGGWCLAEGIIGGHQCTLEGYVHDGEVTIPTIVDSIRVAGGSSFARYQYPSKLPEGVKQRMRDIADRVLRHHVYDNATFNIEMYWDEQADHIWLLEINPRASQSHTVITKLVDGLPHLEAMAALALGDAPAPHLHSRGPYAVAAKFFLRVEEDAFVERVPSPGQRQRLEREHDCHIQIEAAAGKLLSQTVNQDSYSFSLAVVHVGAQSEAELLDKYARVAAGLEFEFREPVDLVVGL